VAWPVTVTGSWRAAGDERRAAWSGALNGVLLGVGAYLRTAVTLWSLPIPTLISRLETGIGGNGMLYGVNNNVTT